MKTDSQQCAQGVKSSLEAKSEHLKLRENELRKELNKEFKINLRITDKRIGLKNNLVGFSGLKKYFSLAEIEIMLRCGKSKGLDKYCVQWYKGVYITFYVK